MSGDNRGVDGQKGCKWKRKKRAQTEKQREALVARRIQNKWREACALIGYCSKDVCESSLQSARGWLVAGSSI